MEPVFFHIDLDAFFAAVEVLDNPSLKGKCIIVGGIGPRSVVSTCSYEARKYGVHSAMPVAKALSLCPKAIVLPARMKRYAQLSKEVMNIFTRFSPDVTQISIDEAFLDMTGTSLIYSSPRDAALQIKKQVFEETGLTLSVGIGPSRYIAKMASDYNKPDGLCRVSPGNEQRFIDAIGLKKLWGIGKVTLEKLAQHTITTPEKLRTYKLETLQSMFGQIQGSYLFNICRGIDPGIYAQEAKSHSISSEITFPTDIVDRDVLFQYLLEMSHEIMFRALSEGVIVRTVGVKIRDPEFHTISAQKTPDYPIYNATQVYDLAKQLFMNKWPLHTPVRLLGVGLYQVYSGEAPLQTGLFDESETKKRTLEKTVLELQKKGKSVTKATILHTSED